MTAEQKKEAWDRFVEQSRDKTPERLKKYEIYKKVTDFSGVELKELYELLECFRLVKDDSKNELIWAEIHKKEKEDSINHYGGPGAVMTLGQLRKFTADLPDDIVVNIYDEYNECPYFFKESDIHLSSIDMHGHKHLIIEIDTD